MIALMSAAMLSAATASFADTKTVLENYSNCLIDLSIEHLELKTTASAFRPLARGACAKEREAMIAQTIKDEMEFGSSRDEAKAFAMEEADTMISKTIDDYANYLRDGTRPVKS